MRKGFLGSLATLLTGAGLALAQAPPSEPGPAEATKSAPATENAVPTPAPEPAPVDQQPWNPSIKQGVQPPYPELSHGWLSGLCPDLGEFWLSGDYLLWAMKSEHLPALMGNSDVDQGAFSGASFVGGVWLDDDHIFGFEGTYFFLAEQSRTLGAAGTTLTATTGLQGAEATGIIGLSGGDHYGAEMLLGFRYLSLKDFLGLTGAAIDPLDQFETRNHFYAGQVGLRAESCYHGLLLGIVGKLALGANEETLDTAGAFPGHFAHSQFVVVPELGVQLGYQFTRHATLWAGYTFIYWSDVARSGDQIARGATGPASPAFSFRETDFWAQGGRFGLEFRY